MKTNIEAIAIKNLQEILRERGYSAEALFSKFDSDHNGVLSKNEFESALRSITGQTAPQAIVNAIFGALDEDSSGSLELDELLSIVESGPTQTYSAGQSISIEGHPDARFNGIYSQQEGQINSKPSFRNQSGCILYAFSSNSESSSSWNLDDRDQNGSNDWYRGGWTRAPKDGSVPLGVKRWVGVGKITLSAAGGDDGPPESPEPNQDQGLPSGDGELGNLMQEIDAASRYFEEQVSGGEMSVDKAIETANSAFDRKIEDLPFFMRSPARKAWDDRIVDMEKRIRENSPSPSTIAAGVGAVGTVGAIASKTSENLPPPVDSRPEPPAAPEPEPPAAPEGDTFSIESAISSFEASRTISERNATKESLSGSSGSIHIRVNSIERTFGIGLSDEFRGGSTLIAKSGDIGELEIRLPSNSDASQFKAGYETEISVTISDWNAVRRRIILEAA
ncbi:MAG: EF-hand domain-containing protein [Candidatus Thalassarchaeaceae archaeon]|nr:EF-hand domain-containing protein [Candidatus Thalassarchaeaceae archaeon]